MKIIVQRLMAKNDVNGNPRRIYVAYDVETGAIVDSRDEGYRGRPEIGIGMSRVDIPDVTCSPMEYRVIRKLETGNVFKPYRD
jgi:hypothetical protein